jgi:hypothetical protein
VICVTHHAAKEYCRWLSAKTGKAYRLPTEAEWEYACRGGPANAGNPVFATGDTLPPALANIDGAIPYGAGEKRGGTKGMTTRVGTYKPNPLGLCDMHGNVSEWCRDWYQPDYYRASPRLDPQGPGGGTLRVARGGAWNDIATNCRSAKRFARSPANPSSQERGNNTGFRIVLRLRPLDEPPPDVAAPASGFRSAKKAAPVRAPVRPPVPGATRIAAPAPGRAVAYTGQLLPTDAPDPVRRKPSKVYAVELQANQKYQIDLLSNQFDPYLRLTTATGAEIASDDDGGDGLNSRLFFTPPASATYRIVVTSFGTGQGAFVLSLRN